MGYNLKTSKHGFKNLMSAIMAVFMMLTLVIWLSIIFDCFVLQATHGVHANDDSWSGLYADEEDEKEQGQRAIHGYLTFR